MLLALVFMALPGRKSWWRSLAESAGLVAGPEGEERRLFCRYAAGLEAVCTPVGAGEPRAHHARGWDVSVGGLSLLTEERWEPGTLWEIELRAFERPFSRTRLALALHVRPAS